ncbi:MAG: DNA polymerase III subunit chi [Kangiellaceae bacterium]|nr:DNA polymerase III subunit chi [Kangiellaceae bacterium]
MTQVEFHILETQSGEEAHLRLVAQCIQALYRQGRKVYVHAKDQQQAHAVDEWLWTQDLQDFIPHNLVGEGPNKAPPVQIGTQQPPENQHDCLINLSNEVQPFFSYFLKCYEIVANEEADKESARERYKFYRGRNYPLKHKKH